MNSYLTGFSVCSLAMLGLIFLVFIASKKILNMSHSKGKNNFLKVENCLSLEPRKNLYVVKAGQERILLASSPEGCNFITKLEEDKNSTGVKIPETLQDNLIPAENQSVIQMNKFIR